jgi:hypothetical protein
VNVALYVPAVVELSEHVTVDVPPTVRVTLPGHDTERAEGAVAVRDTVPAKPNRLENVRPSTSEDPALNEIEVGPAMMKSVTFTARVTE